MRNITLTFILLLITNFLLAQSDEPCTATVLTVGLAGECTNPVTACINPPAYTNSTNASSGVTLPALSCNGFTTTTRDFWFKAVVTSAGKLNVRVYDGGNPAQTATIWDMALYTSSNPSVCTGSSFTQIASECTGSNYPDLTINAAAGTVVFIRMWREASFNQLADRCYTICASEPPTATPPCPSLMSPADHEINVSAPISILKWHKSPTATAYKVYFGTTSPGDLIGTVHDTTAMPASAYSTNYFWSIVPVNSLGDATGCSVRSFTTFGQPTPPTNDECTNAIAIPNNAFISATTFGATQSMAAELCHGFTGTADDDVWYKLTPAFNGSASIKVEATNDNFDPVLIAYTGTCGSLVNMACSDGTTAGGTEVLNLTGLIANTTYYIRLYGYGGAGFQGTYNLTAAGSAFGPAYYRSITSGTWNSPSTWQSSADNITWVNAVLTPTNADNAITIRPGDTVTVNANVTADETTVKPGGNVSVVAGATLTILNNGLILQSNADSSAMIGQGNGTISGNVTIERYVPAKRAWRLISVPLITTQTIRQAWQENGAAISGYGTHITGGTTANGFDQTSTNASSIKIYNQAANTLDALPSTNAMVNANNAYMLFVRGDRSIDLTMGAAAPATNTILRATGTLKAGTQPNEPVAATGFTLVGNPYASSIDFTLLTQTNVNSRFWVWDPKRAGVGAYVLFDAANGYLPLTNGGSYSGANTLLQSGLAFFVEGNGTAGTIAASENCKSAVNGNVYKTSQGNDPSIQVNLHYKNTSNADVLADATLARFSDSYAAAVTNEDAGKLDNIEENIAIANGTHLLTIDRRPLVTTGDTIFLKIYNTRIADYTLEVIPSNFGTMAVSAYMYDSWLNTMTPVNLSTGISLTYKISADPASANPYRFAILFKTNGTLPLQFVSLKGYRRNSNVQIDWSTASEKNVKQYEIERSSNGELFSKAGTVNATGNNSEKAAYSWLDEKPTQDNYYRIKSVDNSGAYLYSNIVHVKMDKAHNIMLYPNPVTGRTLTLQFNDMKAGKYTIQLYNNLGQQVLAKSVTLQQGFSTYRIDLDASVRQGIYNLKISGENIQADIKVSVE